MNKFKKISISMASGLAILGTTVFGTTGKVFNTSQGLVLRGDASKNGAPLATVAEGAEIEIIEKIGEWYKVNANGQEGYLFAEYVKPNEEPEKNNTEQPNEEINLGEDITVEIVENSNTTSNITKLESKIYIVPVITSSVIGVIPSNTEVTIIKTLNNWNYVSYGNLYGWVRTYCFNEQTIQTNTTPNEEAIQEQPEEKPNDVAPEETKPEETVDTNVSFRKGYVNSSSVNVRKEASTSSEVVTNLILNTGVSITGQTDEWYRVVYGDYMGYIHKSLISENPVTTNRGGELREQQPIAVEQAVNMPTVSDTAPISSNSAEGEQIVAFAKQYLGYSYVLGGTTPGGGFDCSGFIYYVFNSCGYSISRSCQVQAQSGVAVSKSELQPGDIVFFNNTSNGSIGHVGIYIGDGRMIHAANPNRGVVTDTINSGYYNTYYYSARRIVK